MDYVSQQFTMRAPHSVIDDESQSPKLDITKQSTTEESSTGTIFTAFCQQILDLHCAQTLNMAEQVQQIKNKLVKNRNATQIEERVEEYLTKQMNPKIKYFVNNKVKKTLDYMVKTLIEQFKNKISAHKLTIVEELENEFNEIERELEEAHKLIEEM